MKKLITILMLLLIIPMNVYGTPASQNLIESESLKYLEMLNIEGLNHYITVNGNKKLLNYYVYMDPFYGNVVVFGNPQDIEDLPLYSKSTMREEYRYLGYNRYGVPVTNTHYPNVAGGINPKEWKVTANNIFVNDIDAKETWENLYKISPVLYEINRKSPLMGNGIEYSENWSARTFDGKSDSDIKVMLLTSAGLYTGITVKIEHTENGQTRYGTFIGEPIDNKRIDSLKVNEHLTTENVIDSKVQVPKEIMQDSTTLTMYGDKDYIDVNIKLDSKIEVDNPLYNPGIIELYNLKLKSYSIEGIEKSINSISGHDGNSGSSIVHNLKLDRNELKVNTNYIKLKWEVELKTKTEKVTNIEYVSTFIVMVDEANKPPKATIQAPTQVYIGDTVNIKGIGEDQETPPEKLKYKWSGDIPGFSEDYTKGIGGSNEFNSEGVFTISLNVMDENMISDTVSKDITVKRRDRALISLEGSITPKSMIYTDNKPNVSLKIDSEGIILDKKGKTTKKVELRVKQLSKDYQIGDSINSVSEQLETSTEDSIKNQFTFDVKTEGKEYTQYFQIEFIAEFIDGTIEKETKILSSKLSKKETVKPLVSVYASPNPVKAGQTTVISGSANDTDGTIKLQFAGVDSNGELVSEIYMQNFIKGWFKWDKIKDKGKTQKEYRIYYVGIDDDGIGASAEDKLVVLPPTVDADFQIGGDLKENRKIILDGTIADVPENYPATIIDWEITAFDEMADINSIRFVGSLDGNLKKDILIKKAGKYKVRLYIENEAGFNDEIFKIIEVKPDLLPNASLTMPERFLSDPNDDNYSTVPLTDTSSSLDGDKIVRRVWFLCFDLDNDGDYLDENWLVHTNGDWRMVSEFGINSFNELKNIDLNKLSYDNSKSVTMRVQAVGHYYVALWVFEEFGQPTIEEFITQQDKKSDTNFD